MKGEVKAKKEYTTLKEYQKAFFPKSSKKEGLEIVDPQVLGATLARQSLQKCKNTLLQKQ
jgi:hypothetical protein